jgi:uncharacterized membrane protein YsdA (DUF1294 family)
MVRKNKGRHPSPILYHTSIALAAIALAIFALRWASGGPWAWFQWAGAWLLAVNGITFAYYGFDKSRARQAGRRVPEAVLHGLALLGGSLGAYAGMRLFRHKTVKGSFRVVFWLIVAVQVVLVVLVVREIWKVREALPTAAAAGNLVRLLLGSEGRSGKMEPTWPV